MRKISVDAFVCNGKARILCVSNSDKILDDGRFVIFRGKYPADVSEAVYCENEAVAQKIMDAFGLVNSPLLIQMINTRDRVSVPEFSARMSGNMKCLLVMHSCGMDVISAAIDLFLGIVPKIKPCKTGSKYDFPYCKPEVYDYLEGFAELKEKRTPTEYFAICPRGMRTAGVTSGSDRIAGMTICANSLEEFNKKQYRFNSGVRMVDAQGNDIMRYELLPDLKED